MLRYNVFKHSNEKEQKLIKLRNKLFAKYNAEKLKSYSIGIYYIATGIYKNDFIRFLFLFFINNVYKNENFFPVIYKKNFTSLPLLYIYYEVHRTRNPR